MSAAEIVVEDPRWTGSLDHSALEDLASDCLKCITEWPEGASVAMLFTHDTRMQTLNATYRGKDKPTNVLAFPVGEPMAAAGFLGDLAFGYETCLQEAGPCRAKFRDHLAHLIVHGLYHLLGYDHISEEEAAEMEAREITTLERLAIPNPYNDMD